MTKIILFCLTLIIIQNQCSSSTLFPGTVDDCCCTSDTVSSLHNQIHPLLDQLIHKAFFRYYKLNLWRTCEFWPNDGQCLSRNCAVDECDKKEFEENWCDEDNKILGQVNSDIDTEKFNKWIETVNPWSVDLQNHNETDVTYIDLAQNPERFTGYKGNEANKIWRAIYEENCFKLGDSNSDTKPFDQNSEQCLEKRVFFKLIAGLHTSITAHLAYEYLIDPVQMTWGPNLTLFKERISDYPDRIKNLYFAYIVVLRALTKLSPFLAHKYTYNTKLKEENTQIQTIMQQIQRIVVNCGNTFDEKIMFQGDGAQLRQQFKEKFHNISRILDCVVCEKCRLWGKVQVNGLATALKILFELENKAEDNTGNCNNEIQPDTVSQDILGEKGLILNCNMELRRTEIIALINVLWRLSESIKFVSEMHRDITNTPL